MTIPNDTSTTGVIEPGVPHFGDHERDGDDDWFKVRLEAGHTYNIFSVEDGHLKLSGGELNPNNGDFYSSAWSITSRLFDANGSLVAQGDASYPSSPNVLTFSPATTDDYFVSVLADHRFNIEYFSVVRETAPAPISPPTHTIQPDGTTGTDAWYRFNANLPGGLAGNDDESLRVGNRDLSAIKFDLTGLPAFAKAAYVELFHYQTSRSDPNLIGADIPVYLPTNAWTETNAAIDELELFSIFDAPSVGGWFRIDVTDLYNRWQEGSLENHGLFFTLAETVSPTSYFYSSDYAGDPNLRPKLTVHEGTKGLIQGTPGDDVLPGSVDDEIFELLGGADVVSAAGGDDLIVAGPGSDFINGGDGVDHVSYHLSNTAVTVDLFSGRGSGGFAAGDTLLNVEELTGSSFDDELIGGFSSETLRGGIGDDTLDGGANADEMRGWKGNDTYYVDSVGDVVVENAGQGIDTVLSSLSVGLRDPEPTFGKAAAHGLG